MYSDSFMILFNTCITNTRLKSAKYQAKVKQQPEAELLLFGKCSYSSSMFSKKLTGNILKNVWNKKRVWFREIIWLIIMKVKIKMKRKHYIDTRQIDLGLLSFSVKINFNVSSLCIKEDPSNIWSSIHEKFNQNWGWVEKHLCLKCFWKSLYLKWSFLQK